MIEAFVALLRALAALLSDRRATPAGHAAPTGGAAPGSTAPAPKPGVAPKWIAIAIVCVAGFEGFSPTPYRDSVGVLTICDGATAADGVDFSKTYTKAECEAMLGKDLPKYDAPLKKCIKPDVYNSLPPHRHAALVSAAYNLGAGTVCRSSIVRDLNAGRVAQACDDFLKFNRAGGHVIKGLTNRRQTERALCRRDD